MSDLGELTALTDGLRRRVPQRVLELQSRFPQLHLERQPSRKLGQDDSRDGAAPMDVMELVKIATDEATADLRETLDVLNRKSRTLARLRFGAALAGTVAGASVIALILGEERGALIAATVSTAGGLMGLVLGFVEDFYGGEGSIRRFRDALADEHRRLALIRGEIRFLSTLDAADRGRTVLQEINGVFAEVQFVRAKLGLTI